MVHNKLFEVLAAAHARPVAFAASDPVRRIKLHDEVLVVRSTTDGTRRPQSLERAALKHNFYFCHKFRDRVALCPSRHREWMKLIRYSLPLNYQRLNLPVAIRHDELNTEVAGVALTRRAHVAHCNKQIATAVCIILQAAANYCAGDRYRPKSLAGFDVSSFIGSSACIPSKTAVDTLDRFVATSGRAPESPVLILVRCRVDFRPIPWEPIVLARPYPPSRLQLSIRH